MKTFTEGQRVWVILYSDIIRNHWQPGIYAGFPLKTMAMHPVQVGPRVLYFLDCYTLSEEDYSARALTA